MDLEEADQGADQKESDKFSDNLTSICVSVKFIVRRKEGKIFTLSITKNAFQIKLCYWYLLLITTNELINKSC